MANCYELVVVLISVNTDPEGPDAVGNKSDWRVNPVGMPSLGVGAGGHIYKVCKCLSWTERMALGMALAGMSQGFTWSKGKDGSPGYSGYRIKKVCKDCPKSSKGCPCKDRKIISLAKQPNATTIYAPWFRYEDSEGTGHSLNTSWDDYTSTIEQIVDIELDLPLPKCKAKKGGDPPPPN